MNITNLINFQSISNRGAQTQSNELNTFAAKSLRIIVEEFFLKMAPSFIIVVSCRSSSPLNFYLTMLQHLFNMVDKMVVQLVFVNNDKPKLRIEGLRLYNLLLVDSLEAFLDIDINSYAYNYDTNEYYHIFLLQNDHYLDRDMEGIFEYCWTYNIINCNIHTQISLGEVRLYTYFPYEPFNCGHTRPQLINQFVNDSWMNQEFFLPKLNNFYGCPLVAIVRHIPPFFNVIQKDGFTAAYKGMEMDLISHISKRMNFTLDIRNSGVDNKSFVIGDQALELLTNRTADLALGFYRKRASRLSTYSTTFPHYQNNIVIVIYLKAQKFNTFEVLYYPFKIYSWISIIVSCIIIVLATLLVHKNHPRSLETFSMIACALGIPIKEHPTLYPCSFIFITWLWSTFILRSMYSGLLYHLFSHEIYRRLPLTMKHIMVKTKKYRAVMNRFTFNDIDIIPHHRKYRRDISHIINSTNEFVALPYLEEHSRENIFAVISKDFLLYYAELYRKPGLFYILPEVFLQQQLCIYMSKHSFLINQFDEEILRIQSVGLIELWSKRYVNAKYFESSHMHTNDVIDQDDLWGIYMICSACQLLAFVIFIIEMLSIKFKFLRYFFK